MQQHVINEKADLGIALDGDGDRVLMVDHQGNVLDGDELLYIIVKHRQEMGILKGGVVGTVMSNFGFEQAVRALDVDFARVPVGDRYVIAELVKRKWYLGGEPSGHIICFESTTTGDGIITALQVLSAMKQHEKSLAELKSGMHKFPQVLVNVKVRDNTDPALKSRIQKVIRDVESELGKSGRVLLRRSGTEPLVRVMVEGEDRTHVTQLANQLADIVKEELA